MAASPVPHNHDNWSHGPNDTHNGDPMLSVGDPSGQNGGPSPDDRQLPSDSVNHDYGRSPMDADGGPPPPPGSLIFREKQVKQPNKVYIGGLPENTRQEDLQSCFGKIGRITNIELKVGYGFVEFESREAAEESVAKYHEGFFMGNKIRVELSRGGGRYAKFSGDPGACFKCGQMGHWARECPNHVMHADGGRRSMHPDPLIDRIQPSSYMPPPMPRDYPPYRDEYPPGRYPPPPMDRRYSPYDYPPPRRPISPPRDFYPPPRRDIYDDRMRGPPPPPARYDARPGFYPEDGPGYPPRGYPPPPRDYDRYDRRAPPPGDRYAPYPPPVAGRPRTPPVGGPVRGRDDFDRPPIRDYPPGPPPPADYRARPLSPPPSARYADYPRAVPGGPPDGRYRRRSQSPPVRGPPAAYDSYAPGGPPYAGPASAGAPGKDSRDYPPPRGGRDDPAVNGGYRRP
ncbi:uncharacterized protein STEHIDRAFT_127304 [Stereum hirsutum FP-91666 SS1]|uniref:uncharacterized protein n=1 Tax=Stereum hirsutum (strain FP-91666) TaxID=721885 RepID=UPI000440C31A|nr:uncharacterized protein STEHIDRAFT_127304 [Stereum hirsutum FP-91666 SS1]EIM92491.1 hypothetical protein STEHIDRAFT_127304 [Stereum hirsutum FP-91666 SS1]